MKFPILASLGLLFLPTPAFAQASKDLVGSWTLVSSTVQQGANTLQPFGTDPKGALIFGADGFAGRKPFRIPENRGICQRSAKSSSISPCKRSMSRRAMWETLPPAIPSDP